jgi:hypothetical protein
MKTLILGSNQKLANVETYEWHEIPKDLNVVDFDNVTLNFSVFRKKNIAKNLI